MQQQTHILDCYNKTAKNYGNQFADELSKKHLDRLLLKSFAAENIDKGKLIDLGCGPGQTTKYLAGCGVTNLTGIDLSPAMIAVAKSTHPTLHFETGDILNLQYADSTFGSAIAFYSIVHFDYEQVKSAFSEVSRILIPDGQFLFSFHVGDNIIHLDEFLDHAVNIDFYFFDTSKITGLLTQTGFKIIDIIERQPYQNAEHASKRAYLWASKA